MSSENVTALPADSITPESSTTNQKSAERAINEDERARKRLAIGLAPQRPTARPTVQRPPLDLFSAAQGWIVTFLLFCLLASTGLMLAAKLSDAPTNWPHLLAYWRTMINGEPWPNDPARFELVTNSLGDKVPGAKILGGNLPGANIARGNYRLRFTDEFNSRTGLIGCTQQAGEWFTDVIPEQGIYYMQLWPGRLTWSTIALADPTSPAYGPLTYRVDASVTIVDVMPTGYSGFIGRYQDPTNFYLFMVDGLARYQIQLWQQGVLTTLLPWTVSPLLNPAGFENILTLEETGTQLQLWANGGALATVSTPVLPAGDVGLLGGAADRSMAEINIDWLRVYERVE